MRSENNQIGFPSSGFRLPASGFRADDFVGLTDLDIAVASRNAKRCDDLIDQWRDIIFQFLLKVAREQRIGNSANHHELTAVKLG